MSTDELDETPTPESATEPAVDPATEDHDALEDHDLEDGDDLESDDPSNGH